MEVWLLYGGFPLLAAGGALLIHSGGWRRGFALWTLFVGVTFAVAGSAIGHMRGRSESRTGEKSLVVRSRTLGLWAAFFSAVVYVVIALVFS